MTPTDAAEVLVSADAQLKAMRLVQVHIADDAGEFEKKAITQLLDVFERRVGWLEAMARGDVDAAIARAETALREWRGSHAP